MSGRSLRLRVSIFVASCLFMAYAIWSAGAARATSIYWDVLPAISSGSIWEYGLHYNEVDTTFGAVDFNAVSDDGMQTYVRAVVTTSLPWLLHYHRAAPDSCHVVATAEFWTGTEWSGLSGGVLHYTHINQAEVGDTASMQNVGTSITDEAGKIASTCSSATHVHESADLDGGIAFRESLSNDTCWADSDGWRCPGTYRVDNPTTPCPPGGSSGTGGITGTKSRYETACVTWSNESRSTTSTVFYYLW